MELETVKYEEISMQRRGTLTAEPALAVCTTAGNYISLIFLYQCHFFIDYSANLQ